MTELIALVLGMLLFALAFSWLLIWSGKPSAKQVARWEAEQQEINKRSASRIEEELEQILSLLELPQLAEETKRRGIARRLRILLIEKLLNGPQIDLPRISAAHSQKLALRSETLN